MLQTSSTSVRQDLRPELNDLYEQNLFYLLLYFQHTATAIFLRCRCQSHSSPAR